MTKSKARLIIDRLSTRYDNKPALHFDSNFELLVAVILSAQCTDARVNKITKELFKRANTPWQMRELSLGELEGIIFSCGLYKSKAAYIKSASIDIIEKFGGQVPLNLKDLTSLAGVGRKTANVVYAVAGGGSAIAVDTHVFRVSNRIGLAKAGNVLQTEKQLMQILDKDIWTSAHHYLIYHGRNVCKAQGFDCSECFLNDLCEKNFKKTVKRAKNV